MWKSDFDYNPETDKTSTTTTIIIVVTSILAALYLAFTLV